MCFSSHTHNADFDFKEEDNLFGYISYHIVLV